MSGSRYSQSSFSYSSSRSTARSAGFLSELSSAVSRNGTKITSETVHQSEEMSVHEEASEISSSSATEKQQKEVELVHNIGMTLRQMRALKREQNQQTTASSQQVSETYVAVEAYTPDDDVTGGISLKQGQRVEVLDTSAKVKRQRLDDDELDLEAEQLLDNSAARHRMSVRPPRRHASPRRRSAEETRWLVRVRPRTSSPPAEGLVPASVLRPEGTSDPTQGAAPETPRGRRKTSRQAGSGATEHLDDQRAAVVRELLETEEEFVKDTQYILENYYHHLDSPSVPRELREKKEALFGNFRELCQFHQRELLEGIKYYADKPLLIGKTFLRLAPDFDKHAIYCRDEPAAQTLLETDKLLAHHFQEHAAALHDDKALSDHLRLPIQRINDYQLLLKDLVQLSSALKENCSDLQRALEFIISVPQRAHDLKFINSIEGFRGNIHRLGRLILHDWFTETESDGVAKQRYLFLFKTCVLVSKPRKVGETKSVFQLKDIIRLSGVKLSDSGEERAFTFHLRAGDTAPYPVRLEAKTSAVKEAWLEQLHALLEEHAREPETSEAHEDDLSVVPSSSEHVDDEEEFVTAPVADGTTEEDPTEPSRTPRPSITSPLPSISENPAEKRDSIGEAAERKTSVSETAGEKESVTESSTKRPSVVEAQPAKRASVTEDTTAKRPSISEPKSEKRPSVTEAPTAKRPSVTEASTAKRPSVTEAPTAKRPSVTEAPTATAKRPSVTEVQPAKRTSVTEAPAAKRQSVTEAPTAKRPSVTEAPSGKRASVTEAPTAKRPSVTEAPTAKRASVSESKPAKKASEAPEKPAVKRQTSEQKPAAMAVDIPDGEEGGKPKFLEKIKGVHCESSEKAVFECVVQAHPPAVVTWLRDNKPLDDALADRVMISSDGNRHTLKLINCAGGDSGLYCARAASDGGIAVCSAQLEVDEVTEEERKERREQHLPHFVIRLKDTEILERASVVFMVKAEGQPEPTIEFFKDDVPLAQDDRVSLTRETSGAYELQIHHVRKQDAGVYKCVATNKKGQEECHGNITVTDPEDPEVLGRASGHQQASRRGRQDRPDGRDRADGAGGARDDDTAVFSLLDKQKEIQDAENTNFTWFKDGEEFDPAERFKVLFKDEEDTLALVFQHVSPDDAGMYTCVAATESGRISCSAELTVQGGVKQLPMEPEAPSVVEGLQKTEVSAGGSAMLECKLRGYPAVNVTWTLNGEEIKPGGRFRMLFEDSETVALIIKNVTEADAGKIQVTARNELGACTSEADLVIKGPPKFRKKIQDMAIMIDETVRIEVDIDGTPKPEVKWYKDGQKLTETDRLRLVEESDTKYVLLIDRMELTDAGSYSIVASNTMGQMSDFWKVTAQAPPKFTKQLLREVVKGEQESATLEVKIQGSPVPKVKWYKDGEEITVDGRHYSVENDGHIYTLTINGLTRTDSAKYTCKISNEFGQDETTCQLHVKCAPEIDSGLGDMDVHEGEPFTLEIEATGYPVPVVKWYIDDVEITEKQNLYKKEHDGKFFRLNVSTANSSIIGTYRCTMKNELGSCETSGFINVLKSPEFEEPLCDTGADENKPLTLKVKILAVPEPEVTWYRDGEPITAKSSEIQISRDGEYYSMTFSNVKEAHQGNYSVMAKNSQGENSSSMHLTVYTLPQILTKFTDLICYINENKILVIEGYGNPIPDPHWFMDGNEIHSSENYVIQQDKHKYRLIIPRVKYEDAGSYKLTLKNRMGEVTEQCKLIVKPLSDLKEPHFFTHLVDNVKMKGEETVMSVEIRGIPQPDVKWYKDGVELAPDVNVMMTRDVDTCVYTLKIHNTGDEDMGDYACVATNEHGEMREECRLEVLFKPEIAGLREVAVIPGESARFHATVKANPKCRLKWQHDGMDLRSTENLIIETNAENTETSLRINTVGMRDGGVYSVVAENAHGETTSNGVLLLRTAIPAFKKRLLNTGARLGQKLLLEAVVAGLPVPDVQWFKDGKPLEVERVDEQTFRHQVEATTSPDYGEYRVVAMNCVGTTESSCTVTEEVLPPVIDARLPTFSKKEEGDTLVLEAKVDGSPPPEITWMKDGEPLELSDRVKIEQLEDGTVRLTVTDLRPEDAGRYRMKASNGNGDACTESAVTVDRVPRKPSFDQTLGDVTVTEGKPLKLEARVLGYPRPVLKWLKNGRPLHGTEHISITTTPQGTTLVEIEGATPEDAGTYSVMAVNDLGDATVEADVTVEQIWSSTCKVTFAPHRKPLMQDAFRPVRAVEGCPARIEGRVSGHPPPTVTWYKDGKPLDANDHGKPYLLPDGTFGLAFDRCLPEDSGAYTAKISNSEGDAEAAAKMEVIGKQRPGEHCAPAFTSPLRDTEVAEGSTLVLTADVTGNPLPDVSWTRDGAPLPSDERVFTGFDGDKLTLTIRPARVKDVGRYQVSLSNALGQADSAADVKVKKTYQAPHFAQKIFDLQQMPKYDAKFMGRVIGIPRPEVQWFFNDTPIKPSSKYRIKRDADMFALYVTDCCPDDAGVYSCVATNADGTSKCSANLEVVDHIARRPKPEPPYFLKTIGDCEVYPGMQGKFTACVAGYPEPDFEWYRDDMRMFPSDRILMEADGSGLIRLILKNADEGDSGRYKLKIFNTHGEAACEAELSYDTFDGMSSTRNLKDQYGTLEQQLKSGIPMPLSERPIISRMTDRQLTLSWRPSPTAGQRIPVTYHVEMAEAPRGDWFTVRSGIRGCSVEIRNLEPHRDYKFRIKVENKLGVSEPSPHITTQRERLVPDPPESMHLRDGETFLPDMSSYFPRDFDMDKWTGGRAHAPTFLRQEKSDQYGVKNHPADLKWYIYGFPMPDVRFTFNGKDIEMGGRYSHSYTRSGELSLFVNKMLDRDTGVYEAIATNASGEARQRVSLHIAEHPRFSLHPEESTVMQRDQARFEARVTGVPYPEIRWYKDWLPLAPSDRIRIHWKEPDTCVLLVNGCVPRDNGLYSISATNVAGTTSASAMLHVEYDEAMYNYISYSPARSVRPRTKAFEDFYNVGDELGRGTQGITYHVVERDSGRNFAAKCMSGKGDHRQMMNNEMWIMNQLSDRQLTRLYDAYESPRQLILVQELCAGGEVLPALCQKTTYNEGDIACMIRQVLWGLQHMHGKHIAHLGLTPGDILYTRPGGDDIKLIDFSYSRHINPQRPERLDYGMPEFVAPEIVNNECVGLPADIWSVGVITYLLLSGTSPFRGENDRETLKKIQTGEMDYDLDAFAGVSEEAKDFITKLLVFSPEERLDVRAALRHPWLKFADHMPSSVKDVSTDRLKIYLEKFRDWYRNASCRTWFRRRPLSSAFTHPSCMVYPPDIEYTPPPSPEPSRRVKWQPPQLELDGVPQREYPDTEIGWVQTESHYQQGPDTYLLQLRDTGLPARLREYMKVAAERSPSYARRGREDPIFDRTLPVVHERRRFTDIMDEEIDDERKTRISRYDAEARQHVPRRLRYELGTRADAVVEAETLLESKRQGQFPFFREKPRDTAIQHNQPCELSCMAVGEPRPIVQWFRNDIVISESKRIKIIEEDDGRSRLQLQPASDFDQGVYKVVARNSVGQTVTKCRLFMGSEPGLPEMPEPVEHSDTEVMLRWKIPQDSGHTPILAYGLQMKPTMDHEWQDVANNIDHEFFCVRGLKPETNYHFRLRALNKFGWGGYSVPSPTVRTRKLGWEKPVMVTKAEKYLQQMTETGREPENPEARVTLDYSAEETPVELTEGSPQQKYSFLAEISRGRFSLVAKCVEKDTDTVRAAKIIEAGEENRDLAAAEYRAIRSLRHERIAALYDAFKMDTQYVLILEKLQGLDILTYFQLRHEYNENMVATVVTQVLDGLQYLHWRGVAHLDLQPDNIVLTSCRRVDVKLVDFGSAQKVTKLGAQVHRSSLLEYTAPELLADEPAFPMTDVWSLGVITYLLLSGTSPFRGETDAETRQNILFVRFRFEYLYREITTEATRFLMQIFKRAPSKRPTCEECSEHRWLLSNDYMLKRRERAVFLGNRLREYSDRYHRQRLEQATQSPDLLAGFGMALSRSLSVETNAFTTF